MRMQRSSSSSLVPFFFLLTLLILQNGGFVRIAEGGKRNVHIPDELDDVMDDEEDEDWKKWGEKSKSNEFDPPPMDPSGMDPLAFQAEIMKRHSGPSFGFVKLGFGVERSRDTVSKIAMKWTRVLKTGSIEAKFMGVDLNTLMFTLEKGQDTTELIEFVLSQPEAYELKIGNQIHRRPGDPPLDEVNEMRRGEQTTDDPIPTEEQKDPKDEL